MYVQYVTSPSFCFSFSILCFILLSFSCFIRVVIDQVEPAISKQVEFSNGYMHADDTCHEFTNKLITSEGKKTLSTSSQSSNIVLCSPFSEFYDDACFNFL